MRLSPEIELVLATARKGEDTGRRQRIASLAAGDLDWNSVVGLATRHGTLPLLMEQFSGETASPIPPEVTARLDHARRGHVIRCLQLSGALLKVMGTLQSRGIRALTFKGPTLALLAYDDITLRRFNDLDLIVHPKDFARAIELLRESGFHSRFEAEPEKERHEVYESGHLLLEDKERVLVEVHERMTGRDFHYPVEFDDLWSRRQQVTLGDVPLDTFSSEDLILYLTAHGAKHSWCSLGWICDCGELMRRQTQIDWPSVFERARAAHCRRILLLGLALAAEQSGTPVPDTLAADLACDSKVGSLRTQVFRDLFCQKRPVFAHALLGFRCRDRMRDSLRHVLSIVFVTRQADWQAMDLSPTLWPVYPLLRPFRLSLKYLHLMLRRSRRFVSRSFRRSDKHPSNGGAREDDE